jgi:rhodanese-related sulfurtransferase
LLVVKFVPGFSALSAALAGSTRMSPVRYFAVDLVGAALWAGTAVLIGDVFRETVSDAVEAATGFGRYGVLAVIVALAMYALWRAYRRQRFLRELRMARVTVDELRAMRARDGSIVIVDARPLAVQRREGRIPGAIPFDPPGLDSGNSAFAADREVVVYCDCPNEASAALVAKRLFEGGARKVRPLKGGISAWAAAGYGIER